MHGRAFYPLGCPQKLNFRSVCTAVHVVLTSQECAKLKLRHLVEADADSDLGKPRARQGAVLPASRCLG